ncbi:MAG: cytochrome b [Methylobacterium mesophilicum]|nr:cytochrome b [Methylobacterium mesophilicum]
MSAQRPNADRKKHPSIWLDRPARYGLVSRFFHWSIAYLLIWQMVTLLGWRLIGDGPFMRSVSELGPYHGTVGISVLTLGLARLLWAIANRRRRPPHERTVSGRIARIAHELFYALMIAIPGMSLLRAYGKGLGYEQWGIQLVPETDTEIAWMMAPADALHGLLAWTFGVLIAGHVGMALWHWIVRRDAVLQRMSGSLQPA